MSFGFAGALMGAGDALTKWGEEKRKETTERLAREHDLNLLDRREEISQGARQQERDWQLQDRQHKEDRANAHSKSVANILSGQGTAFTKEDGSPFGSGKEIAQRLSSDLSRELGLSKEQAAGIVGNFAHETGGFKHYQEISPVVPGSRGGAGISQWTGPRRDAFEAFAKQAGKDPTSYDANLGFLLHELRNTEEGRVLESLKGAQTAEDAAQVFSNEFLRPGKPNMASRQALAGQVLGLMAHPETTPGQRQALGILAEKEGLFEGPKERKILKDANGIERYVGTGEQVFEDVQAAPADEYGRYVREMQDAGQTPLSRIDYAQAKKGNGFSMTTPDGTTIQMGGKSQKLTEAQSKNLVYATRAKGALENLNLHGDHLTSRLDRLADMDPTGLARETQSEGFQLARQAGNEFLQAVLRKDTGAAITAQEQELYGVTYLPQPGDSKALLKQKQQSRRRAIIALEAGMGPQEILKLELAMEEDTNGAQPRPGNGSPQMPTSGSDLLTPADRASPIPNDLIQEGKQKLGGQGQTVQPMPDYLSEQDQGLWDFMTPQERDAILQTYGR